MELTWTVDCYAQFPEDKLNYIVDKMRKKWNENAARNMILQIVCGFEDDVYYNWGETQTDEVLIEVLKRIGGVQLSMFDELGV